MPPKTDVADNPEALQAVGLCGRPNKVWCLEWKNPEKDGKLWHRTFYQTQHALALEKLAVLRAGVDPDARLNRRVRYDYCHAPPARIAVHLKRVPGSPPPACARHGANNKHGPAHPQWGKGSGPAGKYAKILTGNYLEAYAESLKSQELPNLLEQIALCDARERRMVELIEERKRERGDTPAAWRRAKELVAQLGKALRADDMKLLRASGSVDAVLAVFGQLEEFIAEGVAEDAAWETLLGQVLPLRRKLTEAQHRLVATHQMYVPVTEVLITAARMVDAARKRFGPTPTFSEFSDDMEQILVGWSDRAEPRPRGAGDAGGEESGGEDGGDGESVM